MQVQKIISLCGWEPRSLPYVVDKENGSNHSILKANVFDSSDLVADGQNPRIEKLTLGDENSEAPNFLQSDPNSVVLDCRLCGATVGLWTFSTVQQPMEFFQLVGYTELNTENHSAIHDSGTENHPENRRDVISGGLDGALLSKERLSNLNLTIAGGPPPTKQNFKATISLPVIGRNLRARFSYDSEFRDCILFNQEKRYASEKDDALSKENDNNKTMEGIDVIGQATHPDDGMHDFLMRSVSSQIETQERCQGNIMVPENVGNVASNNLSREDPANSHVQNSSLMPPDDSDTNITGQNERNDSSLNVSSGNGNLLHILGSNVVDGKDTSLAGHQEPLSVQSCLETDVDVEKASTDNRATISVETNSQEGGGGRLQTPANNKHVVFSTGKQCITYLLAFKP